MTDPVMPVMLRLPNGSFVYPRQYRSISLTRIAVREGVDVRVECLTNQGRTEIERVTCETIEQADAFGRVLVEAMQKHFPDVQVRFIDSLKLG